MIPENCIAWLCLLGCIRNPDKCPEYFLSLAGLYEGNDVDQLQAEHTEFRLCYNMNEGGRNADSAEKD